MNGEFLTFEKLKSEIEEFGSNVDDFLYWASEDLGYEVDRNLVTQHWEGKLPMVSPWPIIYKAFFYNEYLNTPKMKRIDEMLMMFNAAM